MKEILNVFVFSILGYRSVAELLIQKGVDVDIAGSGTGSYTQKQYFHYTIKMINYLVCIGYTDNTPLIDAAWQGNSRLYNYFI